MIRLNNVGVVGAGTSGKGIIRTLASCGLKVTFREVSNEKVEQSLQELSNDLDVSISRWEVTSGEKRLILSRISGTADMRKLSGSQVVFEATPSDLTDKQKIFEELDALLPVDAILLSNCSTICVSEIARVAQHPERIAGMHFSPPVHRRHIVELVRGRFTSDHTMDVVRHLARLIKKKPLEILEMPGLVTTRIMIPYMNEAMSIVMEGLVPPDQVDEAIKLGFKMPLGPLQMADRMGLDTLLKDMERLFRALGVIQYRPCPILRRMVRQEHLGVKTRRGFFLYDEHGNITGCPKEGF